MKCRGTEAHLELLFGALHALGRARELGRRRGLLLRRGRGRLGAGVSEVRLVVILVCFLEERRPEWGERERERA